LRARLDLSFAWVAFRQALVIGASEMVWAVKMYAATVLLGMLTSGSQVGWFAAGHRVVVSLHTFVWLYFFNLLPSLSRCAQKPLEALLRLTQASFRLTAWLAVFVGVVGAALAEPLMTLLYGEPYQPSAAVFRVLIWLIPLTLLHGHYRYVLIAYGKQQLEFVSQASGAGLNVFLILFLVPAYGPVGGAWALLASELLVFALVCYLTGRSVVRLPFWPHLWGPIRAGIILAVVLYLVCPLGMWIAGITSIAIYLMTMYVLNPSFVTEFRSLLQGNLD
jgi:O-antigen/teichoic acid export membrane protein